MTLQLRELYPYQQECFDKIKEVRNVPLFWEMRLGKSLTIWRWLMCQNPVPKRILIICPKSVIVSWKEELAKEGITPIVYTTLNKETHPLIASHPVIAVVNYECLTANGINLHLQCWDAVICDESTKLRNPRTRITRLLIDKDNFPLKPKTTKQKDYAKKHNITWETTVKKQYRAILSGTPAPESYLDYFNQFKFVFGKLGPYHNYYDFKHHCFSKPAWGSGVKIEPKPNFLPKFAKYLKNYTYELKRIHVGTELPNIYEKRIVQLDDFHQKIYTEFERNWFSEFLNGLLATGLGNNSFQQLTTKFATVAQSILHQMSIGYPKAFGANYYKSNHKLNEVKSLVNGELRGQKMVIWCQYLNDMANLKTALPSSAVIRGGQTTKQLAEVLRRYRLPYDHPDAFNHLICQIRKASMGMDLSAADTQIFFSRSWSSLDNQQAYDRLIHPEKTKRKDFQGILTIDIVTEDTIDMDLHYALIEKKAHAEVYKWFLKRTSGYNSDLLTKVDNELVGTQ